MSGDNDEDDDTKMSPTVLAIHLLDFHMKTHTYTIDKLLTIQYIDYLLFIKWVCLGFPGGSMVKNLPANAGNESSILGSGRSPGEGNGNPLHYICLGKAHGQRKLTDYSPWSFKTVGHDLATKQQQ